AARTRERADVEPPGVSGAGPNIVRTQALCQRGPWGYSTKNPCGMRSSALPTHRRFKSHRSRAGLGGADGEAGPIVGEDLRSCSCAPGDEKVSVYLTPRTIGCSMRKLAAAGCTQERFTSQAQWFAALTGRVGYRTDQGVSADRRIGPGAFDAN